MLIAAAPSTQSAFDQQLAAVDQKTAAIADLTADFTQEKQSPMLLQPLVSRGTVRARGGVSLWITREPEASEMRVDPQRLQMYYPKQKVIEQYPIAGQLGMMAASPLPRLATVRENFLLSPETSTELSKPGAANTVAVHCAPASDDLKKYVDHVSVLLDADRGVALAFEMIDPDDEKTLIRFSNVKLNGGLSDQQLNLSAPPDAKVEQPLGAGAP